MYLLIGLIVLISIPAILYYSAHLFEFFKKKPEYIEHKLIPASEYKVKLDIHLAAKIKKDTDSARQHIADYFEQMIYPYTNFCNLNGWLIRSNESIDSLIPELKELGYVVISTSRINSDTGQKVGMREVRIKGD